MEIGVANMNPIARRVLANGFSFIEYFLVLMTLMGFFPTGNDFGV
jgi:hypothetical protein